MIMMMIMGDRFFHQLIAATMFIGFLCTGMVGYIQAAGALPNVGCIESEQEALLRFKQGFLNNPSKLSRLSSWVVEEEEDCCKWSGVGCNTTTGHVVAIDLHSQSSSDREFLQGELSASLLDLPYLSYLDLSGNDFRQIQIPQLMGSLRNLEYLNLSHANFKGIIPHHLGNLSRLHSLDLSGWGFYLIANNLDWLDGLSNSLKVLDLGGADLYNVVNWLDAINYVLPSLVELRLSGCRLKKLPPSLLYANFTPSVEILDLSNNNFNATIPLWLFNISHSLVYLNLTGSHLQGHIPNAFGNMTSLTVLDLSHNDLEGAIPTTLGLIQGGNQLRRQHSLLRELYLSNNRLTGSLEPIFAQLSKLVVLDVADNSLEGVITEAQFLNFRSLRVLDLSSNSFVFNMSSSWIPAFQLDTIRLRSCKLGPQFPRWLRTQKDFSSIDISNAGISNTVPDWFWNLSVKVEHMNLSFNQLGGKVPHLSSIHNLSTLDLSSNNFDGPLPQFSGNLISLRLYQNLFSGPISPICESGISSLENLDLSRNSLSGQLPADCWTSGKKLKRLRLGNNNLYGKLPDSIGHLPLLALDLHNNSLSGELPSSLKNCTNLVFMILGNNRLSGTIPEWIGEMLQKLMVLILNSNEFRGTIPLQLCQLKSLRILDLSLNNISGTIPRRINQFMAMAGIEYDPFTAYVEDIHTLVILMRELFPFSPVFVPLHVIDFSSNNLSGEIPREITSLIALRLLNLSNNHLTGVIPHDIGAMRDLEALDLSRNKLSCSIPTSMSEINFLSVLDLSHNNLSGNIPYGTQLRSFNATTFMENHNLCGPPLANNCASNKTYEDSHCGIEEENRGTPEEDGDGSETPSFYISMGLGYVTAFCGFWGILLFSSSWRHPYYRFLGNLYDRIYVIVAVNVNRLRRKFQDKHVM